MHRTDISSRAASDWLAIQMVLKSRELLSSPGAGYFELGDHSLGQSEMRSSGPRRPCLAQQREGGSADRFLRFK